MEETSYLKDREDLLNIIRKIPFLNSYSDQHLKDILSLSKMRKYNPDEFITKEGEYDSWLYIILSGEVNVISKGTSIATINYIGATIGEMSVIDGEPRSASIRAVRDTMCLAIDMSIADRMDNISREKFDAIYYHLLAKILVERLRKTTNDFLLAREEIAFLNSLISDRSKGD